MRDLARAVAAYAADCGFQGTVRVDLGARTLVDAAYGLADRAHGIAHTPDTRCAMASGSKTFTALAVLALVQDGVLSLGTSVRDLLAPDLPRLDPDVTIAHLLSHTSGVGEYLDDDAESAQYLLPGSMHEYGAAHDFLGLLDQPMAGVPGAQFVYSNAGFVILGVVLERVTGARFQDVVRERVLAPAGLARTDFLRTDELPGDAAIGYLWPDRLRTNIFHLPIEGSADGGAYTTTADLRAFWLALSSGAIVSPHLTQLMTTPVPGHDPDDPYGLGVWLPAAGVWAMDGADAGVSLSSVHRPGSGLTRSVLSNQSDGAWPMATKIRELCESLGT